jgi:hypothetical protein
LIKSGWPVENVWSFLPDSIDGSTLPAFWNGGVGSGPESRRALVDYIADYLAADTRNCAVFEDALAESRDVSLGSESVPYVTCGADVLHFLIGRHSRAETDALILNAKTYRLVGVLSRSATVRPGQIVDKAFVHALAESAVDVIIGAWDGEAELVWSVSQRRDVAR